jgi:hypothetical protein
MRRRMSVCIRQSIILIFKASDNLPSHPYATGSKLIELFISQRFASMIYTDRLLNRHYDFIFSVLKAVIVEIFVFWDVCTCSPSKVDL